MRVSLHTHVPLVAHLERWCAAHLGRHDSPDYHRYQRALAAALLRKHDEQRAPHDRQGFFGMSKAGGCLRAAALDREGVPPASEPTGAERATWEVGHILECMALAVLEASGFTVEGAQREVRYAGLFLSHVDGVLTGGPVALPYPLPVSVKTASYKMSGRNRSGWTRRGFTALPLDGVHAGQPGWYVQSQLEMAALGAPHALVVVVAKDMIAAMKDDPIMQESGSLTWYAEVLDADSVGSQTVVTLAGRARSHPAADCAPFVYAQPYRWVALPAPGDRAHGWGGPNQEATGTFNYCLNCGYAPLCAAPGAARAGATLEDQLRASLAQGEETA